MEIPKITRLCFHCSKDFELKQWEHNGCLKASVANFEDCPHCKKRNDHWLKVEWSKQ